MQRKSLKYLLTWMKLKAGDVLSEWNMQPDQLRDQLRDHGS